MTTKQIAEQLREQKLARRNVRIMEQQLEAYARMPCNEVIRAFHLKDKVKLGQIGSRVNARLFDDMLTIYVDLKRRVDWLNLLLGSLPADQAAMLEDFYVEQMPEKDVCEKYGLSREEVHERCTQALGELKRLFDGKERGRRPRGVSIHSTTCARSPNCGQGDEMPRRPKRPCSYPGCPALTDKRYCAKHEAFETQRYNRERGSSTKQGYGSRWRKARAAYLSKHPLCVMCLARGQITLATVVDHKIPHKRHPRNASISRDPGRCEALFWDEDNWQSLCKPCHDKKTALEDGRWGRRL